MPKKSAVKSVRKAPVKAAKGAAWKVFPKTTIDYKWKVEKDGLKLELKGTKLEMAVWMAIAQIPEGEVWTYSELAEKAGYPKAIRAVASAVGRNPLPLIIPCHRVVRKGGEIGEFGFGTAMKRELLAREGVNM